ncbi:hypothetical protein M1L60_10885 [Actinoplanes sp. TRM 88003]|uniref:Uncharacterized protein n=1 Tax=Paractinoplanes aksuensis TaxID=2939490 RepID=A0ABT1DJT0_9ACTN|nr:hypothetical protein [Actinoplanes aksuensis]MCO8271098.1 hypothetical protein [Actinoplanes aksuensis]
MLVAQYAIYAVTLTGVAAAALLGFASAEQVAGPAMLWFDLVMVTYGVRASRHPGLAAPARRFSWALTAALAMTTAITLIFMLTGTKAFPQLGDALHLIVTIVLFAALMLVPVNRATKRERWKTLLDAGIVAVGASMLLWYFVIGPALEGHHRSWRLILAAACYPLVDLMVLFGLARVLMRGSAMPCWPWPPYGKRVFIRGTGWCWAASGSPAWWC